MLVFFILFSKTSLGVRNNGALVQSDFTAGVTLSVTYSF